MKKLIIPLLLISSSLIGATINITPEQKIARALVDARPGDTISLAPGVYKESISIKDRVTVIGSSPLKTFIKGNGRETAVVLHGSASVQRVTISNGQNGVQSQSGNARIDNCIITANRGSGILAVKSLPEIEHSVISHNGGNGITATTIGGGSLILDSLTIAANSGFGIDIESTEPVAVSNSILYKNGIKAFNDRSGQLVATNNAIFPEQKEYLYNNRSEKPLFDRTKEVRALYMQSSDSPSKGLGAHLNGVK